MLCGLRDRLGGHTLARLFQLDHSLSVSAYAADISIFVTSQADVQGLANTLSLYEGASSAHVNWAESKTLLLGMQRVYSLPGGLQWGKDWFKVLSVFLDTKGFRQKTRREFRRKCAQIVVVEMEMVAIPNVIEEGSWLPIIWFTVCSSPWSLVEDIQRNLVDFFSSVKHWVRAASSLPLVKEAKGLLTFWPRVV